MKGKPTPRDYYWLAMISIVFLIPYIDGAIRGNLGAEIIVGFSLFCLGGALGAALGHKLAQEDKEKCD